MINPSRPKLIEVPYGLASVYEEFVEVNHKLYGQLRTKIIQHENRHKADRHYTKEDLKNDFQSQNSYFFESLTFCVRNPECFIGFFPFMYSYYAKRMTFNTPAVVPFMYFGGIFSLVISLFLKFIVGMGFWMSLLYSSIGYIVLFALVNIILLAWTHRYVKKNSDFVYKQVLS